MGSLLGVNEHNAYWGEFSSFPSRFKALLVQYYGLRGCEGVSKLICAFLLFKNVPVIVSHVSNLFRFWISLWQLDTDLHSDQLLGEHKDWRWRLNNKQLLTFGYVKLQSFEMHGVLWWTKIPFRLYSCLRGTFPGIGPRSTMTLTRLKHLLKMNE